MAKAKKLPSGMWRCQASVDGERKSFTAWTKKEAEYLAVEWQTGRKDKHNPDNLTVGELIDQYINSRTAILSPTTISEYRKSKRLYFDTIKSIKIGELRQIDVQKEINELSATHAPKTVKNAYALLKSATKIDFDIRLPQKRKPKYRTPNVSEIKVILDKTAGTLIEVPVLLSLWCSLRMSEIRGLKWDKVKPDRIIIDNAIVDVDGEPVEKSTKTTSSERTIEISKYLYDKIQSQPHTTDYVCNLSGKALYHRFCRLTGNICRFHDLRHANASIMLMIGIPDNYAMQRGGWETEDIYKKTYAQVLDEGRDEATARLDDFFLSLLNAHENAHDEDKNLLN